MKIFLSLLVSTALFSATLAQAQKLPPGYEKYNPLKIKDWDVGPALTASGMDTLISIAQSRKLLITSKAFTPVNTTPVESPAGLICAMARADGRVTGGHAATVVATYAPGTTKIVSHATYGFWPNQITEDSATRRAGDIQENFSGDELESFLPDNGDGNKTAVRCYQIDAAGLARAAAYLAEKAVDAKKSVYKWTKFKNCTSFTDDFYEAVTQTKLVTETKKLLGVCSPSRFVDKYGVDGKAKAGAKSDAGPSSRASSSFAPQDDGEAAVNHAE